jgi:hypothetical protein
MHALLEDLLDKTRDAATRQRERDAEWRKQMDEVDRRREATRVAFVAKHGAVVWEAAEFQQTSKFVGSLLFDFLFYGELTERQVDALRRTTFALRLERDGHRNKRREVRFA